MKIFLVILTVCLSCIYAADVQTIDTAFMNSLFKKAQPFNTIKNGYADTVINGDLSKERELNITAFLEEQCITECIKNLYCIRYAYSATKNLCTIRLNPLKRKSTYDKATYDTIRVQTGVSLDTCQEGVYCPEQDGQKFCDPLSTTGDKCTNGITYEYSEWSDWSDCSAQCDGGSRKRNRKCFKKYFDDVQRKSVSEEVVGNDWLCQIGSTLAKFEAEDCNTQSCSLYGDWKAWGACSKLCNGFRNRTRECLKNPSDYYCSAHFLNEKESCGIDCSPLITKLYSANEDAAAIASMVGTLAFFDAVKEKLLKVYTTDSATAVNYGQIACKELGFSGMATASSRMASDVMSKYEGNPTGMLQYLQDNAVGDLVCSGTESSVKNCQLRTLASEVPIYEIDVECMVNGYWADWGAWNECSVTCGAGIRARQRSCSNPSPSTSASGKNGASCTSSPQEIEQCTMPRCKTV